METLDLGGTDPRVQRPGERLLSRARRSVDEALREFTGDLPPGAKLWSGFHFGWWDERGRPDSARPGKALRPALALGCGESVGGAAPDIVPVGAAVELVHNFSLIHDDVIDGDRTRRDRPTVWSIFGVPAALLGGDALLVHACAVLARALPERGMPLVRRLCGTVQELIEGQAMDLAFEARDEVSPEEYTAMALGKTGSLMGAACALGALAAGSERPRADHLDRFGRALGLAFQITDDLLGLFGDARVTGKPVGADLARRKKTYPVLAALTAGGPAAAELAELYARPEPLTGDQVAHGARLVERAGGRDLAREAARDALEQAFGHLDAAEPLPGPRRDLAGLALMMTDRSH
ncbi:polyprenyl synthetase family protein [Streptomyces sp. LP05-1]|uniref:Polyprenyl synthetase family protein n=1 Tax=Streptomyces pyxinae TaxID=2970734 RepID=A0ABT2CED2_9ACTN|nr:polyprenyl synthetase family protein [Streptomyces sp. LP05-1]MCS0635773.1 polyprenyl synthetase family protein [Streptomyces sp. LP05-1]